MVVVLGHLVPAWWGRTIGFSHETAGFCWGFLVSFGLCPLVFLGYWFLQLQVWDTQGKKQTRGTHHCVIPQGLKSSAEVFFSPLSRVFLCLFYMKCPGCSVVHNERNREKSMCSIFLEVEDAIYVLTGKNKKRRCWTTHTHTHTQTHRHTHTRVGECMCTLFYKKVYWRIQNKVHSAGEMITILRAVFESICPLLLI